jgi:hypothetical protein
MALEAMEKVEEQKVNGVQRVQGGDGDIRE